MNNASLGIVFKMPAEEARCKRACPAGINIPRYVRLVSECKFNEALAVIREKIPFPSICSYVCFRPCEGECVLNEVDRPIAINALKRFVSEYPERYGMVPGTQSIIPMKPAEAMAAAVAPVATTSGKKVAVVGSGPAGLTAAYYLAKLGHAITIFEALPQLGGVLRSIPQFILPQEMLQAEIDAIVRLGIKVKVNKRVSDVKALLNEGYNVVFVATGASQGRKLPIPGADFDDVLIGTSFLSDVNSGKEVRLGKKVLVLGGGGVAIDVARTALRLGASEVNIACLEPRESMPALPWEIEEAEKEGIVIYPLRTFIEIIGDNRSVSGVKCLNLRWMEFDSEGNLHFDAIQGSEHVLAADTVIFAVGQVANISPVSGIHGVQITRRSTINVAPETMATGNSVIFAGGDVASGPASVIEAIAAGRKAASSIDKYLGGQGIIDEVLAPPKEEPPILMQGLPIDERSVMPSRAIEERGRSFSMVELGFDRETAIAEAKRCLRCDIPITIDATKCVGCLTCAMRCALRFEKAFNPMKAKLKVINLFEEYNEISFTDECDDCGLCARYCPYYALFRGKRK